jgi:hypothetical protein
MAAADFYNGYLSKGKGQVVTFHSEVNGLFGQPYLKWVEQKRGQLDFSQ